MFSDKKMSGLRTLSQQELDLATWFASRASEKMLMSKASLFLIEEFEALNKINGYCLSFGETLLAWTELQMDENETRSEGFTTMENWFEYVYEGWFGDAYRYRLQLKDWSDTNREFKSVVVIGLAANTAYQIPVIESQFENEIWSTSVTVCKIIEKQ